jgi:hypothetical protein
LQLSITPLRGYPAARFQIAWGAVRHVMGLLM